MITHLEPKRPSITSEQGALDLYFLRTRRNCGLELSDEIVVWRSDIFVEHLHRQIRVGRHVFDPPDFIPDRRLRVRLHRRPAHIVLDVKHEKESAENEHHGDLVIPKFRYKVRIGGAAYVHPWDSGSSDKLERHVRTMQRRRKL